MSKPTIDVGPAIEGSRLPGWLKWVFRLFRGKRIGAGPVDIQLDQQSIPAARTGLDQPHKPGPVR